METNAAPDDGRERSPDGKYIYFHADRESGIQIWRTLRDGSEAEQLTPGDYQNCYPHLSPDGSQMVFLSYPREVSGIRRDQDVTIRLMPLAEATGRKIKILASLVGGKGTIDLSPWSPDGRRIVFISYQLVR